MSIVVPPGQGGVRDFAEVLAAAMSKEHTVQVIPWPQHEDHGAIERMFSADCIYLQYSGYGYAKSGAPLWLLRDLRRNRRRIKQLGIFFHELYAYGLPWSSAFWLSPVQRYVACELSKLSDFWLTNREDSAQWLCHHAGNTAHAVLPVFSNVGELPFYSSKREPKIVVFGGAPLRLATYSAAGNALFAWARNHGLTIHDIGPTISDLEIDRRLTDEGVIMHGRLPESEISFLLQDALYGLVAYPINYVTKSGVFAAYCAHGICPVLFSADYAAANDLVPYRHYLPGIPKDDTLLTVLNVGHEAWNWYQSHSVNSQVETVSQFIKS